MNAHWHPTEEDLILHVYGEPDPRHPRDARDAASDETDEIDAHVASCAACRAIWSELRETLTLVDAANVPEPDEGFERVMWARVEAALPARPPAAWWRIRQLVPVAGLTAVVVAAVVAGYTWRGGPTTPAIGPAAASSAAEVRTQHTRERVLLTALDDHFEQTQMLLVELLNAPDTNRTDLQFERTTADDLVASGRLYRVTARQTGDMQFAQMLEDLESVLVEVARSPDTMSTGDLKSLRARIEDEGLLFKVRAVTNEIHDRQKDLWTSTE